LPRAVKAYRGTVAPIAKLYFCATIAPQWGRACARAHRGCP